MPVLRPAVLLNVSLAGIGTHRVTLLLTPRVRAYVCTYARARAHDDVRTVVIGPGAVAFAVVDRDGTVEAVDLYRPRAPLATADNAQVVGVRELHQRYGRLLREFQPVLEDT